MKVFDAISPDDPGKQSLEWAATVLVAAHSAFDAGALFMDGRISSEAHAGLAAAVEHMKSALGDLKVAYDLLGIPWAPKLNIPRNMLWVNPACLGADDAA